MAKVNVIDRRDRIGLPRIRKVPVYAWVKRTRLMPRSEAFLACVNTNRQRGTRDASLGFKVNEGCGYASSPRRALAKAFRRMSRLIETRSSAFHGLR